MAAVKRHSDDQSGVLTSAGSADVYTVRTFSGVTELQAGLTLSFLANRANDGPASLAVDGLGAYPLLDRDGGELAAGALKTGRLIRVALDANSTAWRVTDLGIVNNADLAEAPLGTIKGNDGSGVADIPADDARVLLNVDRLPNKTEEEMVADGAISAALAEKATGADVTRIIAPLAARTGTVENNLEAVSGQLSAVLAAQGGGFIGAKTWADLATLTSTIVGALAEVPESDTGTHTDPVTGAANTPNSGIFAWSQTPPGWGRLRPNEIAALKAEVLRIEEAALGLPLYNDAYANAELAADGKTLLLGYRFDGTVDVADTYPILNPEYRYAETFSDGSLMWGIGHDGTFLARETVPFLSSEWLYADLCEDGTTVFRGVRFDGSSYPGSAGATSPQIPAWVNNGEVTVLKTGRRVPITSNTPAGTVNVSPYATADKATYTIDNGTTALTRDEDLVCRTSLLSSVTRLIHLIGWGQSLRYGTGASPQTLTPFRPGRAVMSNVGDKVTYPLAAGENLPQGNLLSLVDAYELSNAEGPSMGSAWALTEPGRLADTDAVVVSNHSMGGQPWSVIKKGGSIPTIWGNLVTTHKRDRIIALMNGISYDALICGTHGEADRAAAAGVYKGYMGQLWVDGSTDIVGFKGLIISQMSAFTAYGDETSAVPGDQLAWVLENLTKGACVGPKYMLPTNPGDGIHLTGPSSVRLGCYEGRTIDRFLKNLDHRPLHCTGFVKSSATVFRLPMHVPVGALTLDTTAVTDPGNYGISWRQAGGTARTISSVAISGNDIVVTLSGDPGAFTAAHFGIALYGTPDALAGPTTGARSCFRDQAADLDKAGVPMPNWACHQRITVL